MSFKVNEGSCKRWRAELRARFLRWRVCLVLTCVSLLSVPASHAQAPPSSPAPSNPAVVPQPAPPPGNTSVTPNSGGVQQTPQASQPPQQQPQQQPEAQAPANGQDSVFVFKKEVQEVMLHATVVDEQRRLVTNLDRSAFAVFEDGVPQTTTSFRKEGVPV